MLSFVLFPLEVPHVVHISGLYLLYVINQVKSYIARLPVITICARLAIQAI